MESQLSVIILGQSKVGKSTLGNTLLGLKEESLNRFIVHSADTGGSRNVIGSARLCAPVNLSGREGSSNQRRLQLHIIDTPGLFQTNAEVCGQNWRDLVHAFDMCNGKKVGTFMLLLRANDGENGEKVVNAFLDMYGEDGRARCLVVFTHNDIPYRKNSMRHIQIAHFEYLQKLLKTGFPFHVWRTDIDEEQQRREILMMISDISDHNQYTKAHFAKAQEIYTLKAVKQFKTEGTLGRNSTREDLVNLGVPDILFGRYLSDAFSI